VVRHDLEMILRDQYLLTCDNYCITNSSFFLETHSSHLNLGLGSSLPRNNFYDENWQGARLGEHPKKFGTRYLFLQPLKLDCFRFSVKKICRDLSHVKRYRSRKIISCIPS